MAATVGNYDERRERIIMVAEYVMATGSSSRNTADFFSKNYFNISNATVSEYCKEYEKLFPLRKDEIRSAIEKNKEKTIKDPEVLDRVLLNTNLVLEHGLSIAEISQTTGVNYWTVYKDLTERLKMVDESLYYQVRERFKENSLENIKR